MVWVSLFQRLSSRALPDEQPEERILRKLYRKQAGFTRDNAARHEPWLPTQKLPRLLTTSASAIRKIQRLQHLAHDTRYKITSYIIVVLCLVKILTSVNILPICFNRAP